MKIDNYNFISISSFIYSIIREDYFDNAINIWSKIKKREKRTPFLRNHALSVYNYLFFKINKYQVLYENEN